MGKTGEMGLGEVEGIGRKEKLIRVSSGFRRESNLTDQTIIAVERFSWVKLGVEKSLPSETLQDCHHCLAPALMYERPEACTVDLHEAVSKGGFMKPTLRALVLIAVVLSSACSRPPLTVSLEDGTQFPIGRKLWPAPENVARRLEAAGLPNVVGQPETFHLHVHLQVFKDGKQVMVPANVGVGKDVLAPLHTHEDHGVLHVESPTEAAFTVGQFFKLWDVPLDGATLLVNNQVTPDPASYVLKNRDLLTVYWGTPPQ